MEDKNQKPNVSIITVCRDPGSDIIKTIESVLAQDYDDFEYVIEDGGSTDDTLTLIEGYKAAFKKRNISMTLVSEKDSGIYDGMNRAVGRCRGTWINFMNAGDCFYSASVLSDIFNKSNYPNAAILYGDAVECEFGHYHMFRKAFDKIEERMPFSHQSAFINRELMSRYPYKTDYRIGADYDFLLSMYKKGFFFRDTGVITCIISKNGVSSLKLYDTYMETLKIRNSHGISGPTAAELTIKLREMKVKQLVMDHFPVFIKKLIRQVQLRIRKQNARLTIPEWESQSRLS
ncbi:MAG: glycosyltransferase [Lachnospiraceae bacterium]|nr:glycosyltransferase [Lachnospiraceae bacterium]